MIPGTVRWIPPGVEDPPDAVESTRRRGSGRPDARRLGDDPWVYFVHSLHGVPDDPAVVAATCEYGATLNAAFRLGNVFATQFHPEKSGPTGLRLLRQLRRRVRRCATAASARDDDLDLYPAIDLRGGRVVRLSQGDYDAETVYGDDPVASRGVRRRRRAVGARRRPRRRPVG